MSKVADGPATSPTDAVVLQRLSTLDRFLPIWIGAAMALGLVLGRVVTGLDDALATVEVGTVSLPIAIGLLAMLPHMIQDAGRLLDAYMRGVKGVEPEPGGFLLVAVDQAFHFVALFLVALLASSM